MMNSFCRYFFLLILLFQSASSAAQLKFALKIIEDLTSPDMHGRGYVNGGDSIAAAYIAEQYSRLGACKLGNSWFQEFTFPVSTFPDSVRVTVDGKHLVPGVDYLLDPSCPDAHGTFRVVRIRGNEIYSLPSEKLDENSILVVEAGTVTEKDSLQKWNEQVNLLHGRYPIIKLTDTKLTWSVGTDVLPFPSVVVRRDKWPEEAREVSLNIRNVFKKNHKAKNVIGYIKGRKRKNPYFVFTAHYDHLGKMGSSAVFPGANDNASGVAQLLNLMKYYSGNPPEYNMVFIAFAGEEAGLLGSRYYTENPLFSLEKIKFLVNLDIMGTGEEGITVVNGTKHRNEFDLLKKINDENDFLKEIKIRGEAANSDHYFFSQKGVPAFFIYTMGGSKAYHDVNDRMSGLSFSEFEDISKLLIEFVKTF